MATWCSERAGAERQPRDADPVSRGATAASGMVVGSTAIVPVLTSDAFTDVPRHDEVLRVVAQTVIDGRFGARSRDRLAWQSERRHWTDRRRALGDRPAGEERTRRWNGL